MLAAAEANRADGIVDERAKAELAAELAEVERPVDLAHLVVGGLHRGAEGDVAVHRTDVEYCTTTTTAASAAESATTRLEAKACSVGSAPAGSHGRQGGCGHAGRTGRGGPARNASQVRKDSSGPGPGGHRAAQRQAGHRSDGSRQGCAARPQTADRRPQTADRRSERARGR